MYIRHWLLATALIALMFAGQSLFAAVPNTMPYHGYLTNSAGQPVNGTVSVAFALYDVPSGGTALWSETQSTNVVAGVLATDLGNTVGLTAPLFDNPLYLGITVGTDPEMAPRLRLGSVPFARNAGGIVGCVPQGCIEQQATCGLVNNGCGAVISCGACNTPQTCGGGGTPNVCGP